MEIILEKFCTKKTLPQGLIPVKPPPIKKDLSSVEEKSFQNLHFHFYCLGFPKTVSRFSEMPFCQIPLQALTGQIPHRTFPMT